jgi:pyruvate dehydrogenase complex dehydrogenase (E1) component
MFGKIMDARGWTLKQVLWGESWLNLLMESADQLRYTKTKPSITVDNIEDLRNALGR